MIAALVSFACNMTIAVCMFICGRFTERLHQHKKDAEILNRIHKQIEVAERARWN